LRERRAAVRHWAPTLHDRAGRIKLRDSRRPYNGFLADPVADKARQSQPLPKSLNKSRTMRYEGAIYSIPVDIDFDQRRPSSKVKLTIGPAPVS